MMDAGDWVAVLVGWIVVVAVALVWLEHLGLIR